MNKKERLMAVLNGRLPDRPPVGFWFHFDGENGSGEACVKAHVKYYRDTDIDFVKIMSDGLLYPLKVTIDKAEDWFKVQPLPHDDPFFTQTVQRCAQINREIGDECYTFYNFFSPFNVVRACDIFTENALKGRTWDETVMAHMRENEAAMKHALCVIARDLAYLAAIVIREGGCLGIYQSVQGAEKGRMSAEEYARVVEPSDRIVLDAFNAISPYNMLHMCSWAGDPNHLEYWKDYPCRVKNWGIGIEGLTLTQAETFFPKGSVFLGGMDNRRDHPLYCGNENEVKAAVRDVLREMKGKPFILGADCTVPNDIDLNHLRWVMETVKE